MHSIGVRYRRPKALCAPASRPSAISRRGMRRTGVRGTSEDMKGNFAITLSLLVRAPFRKRHAQPRSIPQAGRSCGTPYGAGPPVHTARQDRQCRLPLSSSRVVGPASTPGLFLSMSAQAVCVRQAGETAFLSPVALFYALRVTRLVGPSFVRRAFPTALPRTSQPPPRSQRGEPSAPRRRRPARGR